MTVRRGDTVKVLKGDDRGKTGRVLSVNPKKQRAVVEGVNLHIRHERPRRAGQKGQKIEVPLPVHLSNLLPTRRQSKAERGPVSSQKEKKAEV